MGFLLKTRLRAWINILLMIQYRAGSLFFRLDVPVEPNWYLSCLSSCLSYLVKVESHIWVVVHEYLQTSWAKTSTIKQRYEPNRHIKLLQTIKVD